MLDKALSVLPDLTMEDLMELKQAIENEIAYRDEIEAEALAQLEEMDETNEENTIAKRS